MMRYSNITLSSLNGDLSVVVYLPDGIKPAERTYYRGTRFDHGSMIGSVQRKVRTVSEDGASTEERVHTLYGTDLWRQPHNTNWPESGVGLAGEFGVGDDGDFCFYRCGWPAEQSITNGVLGYREAKIGEPFLKIGVGELIKGTCPACDSAEEYRFNSPYLYGKTPVWSVTSASNFVNMEHEASLRNHGYRLQKQINLSANVLTVTSTLTNTGSHYFSTVWYSHNFFNCDSVAVGPGYDLDLNLRGDKDPIYEEPGTWSWSTPLKAYAIVKRSLASIHVQMKRALDPGIKIKTEFVRDRTTNGGFTIQACGTKIATSYPEVEGSPSSMEMYAYNLYIERGTFSPEPQILMRLNPGESRTWTQRLEFSDIDRDPSGGGGRFNRMFGGFLRLGSVAASMDSVSTSSSSSWFSETEQLGAIVVDLLVVMVVSVMVAAFVHRAWKTMQRRRSYDRIDESSPEQPVSLSSSSPSTNPSSSSYLQER